MTAGRKYTAERVVRKGKLMADKPSKGLAGVIAASTALSDVDGRAGERGVTWTPLGQR
jgi:hypothetical protein